MSYLNQRAPSASGTPQLQQQSHGLQSPAQGADSNMAQSQASPLDWSNYTFLGNGNTPPTSGPTSSSQSSNYRPQSRGAFGDSGSSQSQSQDAYQTYNQGGSANGSTGQPQQGNNGNYGYTVPPTRPTQQYNTSQSSMHVPSAQQGRGNDQKSTSAEGKGKSPANRPPSLNRQQSNSNIENANADNGLSLDPAAFSRDIRFQIPQFLSNQMGGAPTFPPGGEAWSGFLNASFGGDMNAAGPPSLTPGSTFNNIFGLAATPDGGAYNNSTPNDGNDNRNVLQGLSGFMDGDNAWQDWNMDMVKPESNSTPAPTTTFYVNPNPNPNSLSQQQQRANQQSRPQNNNADTAVAAASTARPIQSPRNSAFANTGLSPQRSSIPTAAILPPVNAFHNSLSRPDGLPYVPSMSAPVGPAHNINIASSSTAPYAPPSNTEQLLSGPSLPSSFGPSLSDGPGLYSTTGFDMVGVLARVANRKDPKTVLGPIDLSCSFVVVVSRSRLLSSAGHY